MDTIPAELKKTPVSIGFYLSIALWLSAITSYLTSAFIFVYIWFFLPLVAPAIMIWTITDTIKGKKWGVLGRAEAEALRGGTAKEEIPETEEQK